MRRTARKPKLREQRNGDSFIVFSLHLSTNGGNPMFAKTLTAALAGTALLVTVASAQTPTTARATTAS
jgi:hypothetical protein